MSQTNHVRVSARENSGVVISNGVHLFILLHNQKMNPLIQVKRELVLISASRVWLLHRDQHQVTAVVIVEA